MLNTVYRSVINKAYEHGFTNCKILVSSADYEGKLSGSNVIECEDIPEVYLSILHTQ